MLKFQKTKKKRNWVIVGGESEVITELQFISSSITNKFEVVESLVSEMTNTFESFNLWYETLTRRYVEERNSEYLLSEATNMLAFASAYIEDKGVDYSKFANKEKASKTSIMFDEHDIRAINIVSTALKLYSPFWHEPNLKPTDNIHRKIYEKLITPCRDLDTVNKIFKLVRSKVYSSSLTDKELWSLITIMISEDPESYMTRVFIFLMNNMISTLEVDSNPIPFLVSLIDDSINWLMRTIYKDKVIYGESFSGSDDIYGSTISKESFYLYCCNDTIGKAAKIGMNIIEDTYNISSNEFTEIKERIDSIEILTPPMRLTTLPIASHVLEIPYNFLKTCSPKHAALIGVFMNAICKDILNYSLINEFLLSCPGRADRNFVSTRSSYRIRHAEIIVNNEDKIYGFDSRNLKYNIMSVICGVLNASKRGSVNVLTGKPLKRMSYIDLETDVSGFFTKFYSGGFKSTFKRLTDIADSYF